MVATSGTILSVVYFIAEWLAKCQSWIQQGNVVWVD
jgi:hypothetical protein